MSLQTLQRMQEGDPVCRENRRVRSCVQFFWFVTCQTRTFQTRVYYVFDESFLSRNERIPSGLSVKSLLPGSPAQKCGKIKVGDIILKVNGDNVHGPFLSQ